MIHEHSEDNTQETWSKMSQSFSEKWQDKHAIRLELLKGIANHIFFKHN